MARSGQGAPGAPLAAVPVAVVLFAGTLAAVLAHVAIDVLGDYLLRHDAYDRIAHGSRPLFGTVACVIGTIVAIRYCSDLLHRRPNLRLCAAHGLRAAGALPAWAFVLPVIIAATAMLLGMETLDVLAGGTPIHGIAALFGGSIWLGGATTIVSAAGIGSLVRALLRFVVEREPQIAAFVVRLLRAHVGSACERPPAFASFPCSKDRPQFSRCADMRAPPRCART